MHSLLDLDKVQLDRINEAMTALARQSAFEQRKKSYLLQALESERQELIRSNPAIRQVMRAKAA